MSKKNKKNKISKNVNNSISPQQNLVDDSIQKNDIENIEIDKKDNKKNNIENANNINNKIDKNKIKIKKEKKQSKLGRKLKETASELKKVSWPSFSKVVKQTLIVLGVVIFFGLILFGFDYILSSLFKLLNGNTLTAGEMWGSIGIVGAFVVIILIGCFVWIYKKKKGGK